MQLFKTFFKIVWDNKIMISIYFVLYAILLLIQTWSGQKSLDENFSSKSLDIAVIDEDHSVLSEGLHDYLASIHHVYEDVKNDPEELLDHIYYRTMQYILIIPEGFEEKVLAGETENVLRHSSIDMSGAEYFVSYQTGDYMKLVEAELALGCTVDEAVKNATEVLSRQSGARVVTFSDDQTGSDLRSLAIFYQYLPYIYTLILMCGLTPCLQTFMKKDLRNRIECSSQKDPKRKVLIAVSCVAFAIIVWMVFELLILVTCGADTFFSERALYAIPNSLCSILSAVALALLVSCFNVDNGMLNLISNIYGLSTSFLCGVFVPQNMLSEGVLAAGKFFPQYWYVKCNNMLGNLSAEVFDTASYWKYIGIQLLFAIFFFALAMVFNKIRKQK